MHILSRTKKSIEEEIDRHMGILVNEITNKIDGVISIILTGSFGRGEGSVMLIDGKAIPLKDYDLFVVVEKIDGKVIKGIDKIKEDSLKKIGVQCYSENFGSPSRFNITIELIPVNKLSRLPPDISNYELKTASEVLWGEDVRDKMNQKVKDIPVTSGLRTLLNKTIGLIEQFEPEYLRKPPPKEIAFAIEYHNRKIYLDSASALLLLHGKFQPTYKKRAELLERYFGQMGISEVIPDLDKKVIENTRFKLNPKFTGEKIVASWFSARDDLGKVIKYISREEFGINSIGWHDFIEKFYEKAGVTYYNPYLNFFVQPLGKTLASSSLKWLSLAARVYENISGFSQISAKAVPIKIYCSSLSTLFSVQQNETIDKDLLSDGRTYLEKLGVEVKNDDWKTIRDSIVATFKRYNMEKRVKKSL